MVEATGPATTGSEQVPVELTEEQKAEEPVELTEEQKAEEIQKAIDAMEGQ